MNARIAHARYGQTPQAAALVREARGSITGRVVEFREVTGLGRQRLEALPKKIAETEQLLRIRYDGMRDRENKISIQAARPA